MSLPHDYTPDLTGLQAPLLPIHGRYDRMVPFEEDQVEQEVGVEYDRVPSHLPDPVDLAQHTLAAAGGAPMLTLPRLQRRESSP